MPIRAYPVDFVRRAGLRPVAVLAALAAVSGFAMARSGVPARQQPPYLGDAFPSTYAPLPRADTLIVHATILSGAGHRAERGRR
jgi:hypothetical protein